MEKNPYTFCTTNPRRVIDGATVSNNVMIGTGALFLYSVFAYQRRFFRVDKNVMNLVAFTALSAPASYSYANFFLSSATVEAGAMNN